MAIEKTVETPQGFEANGAYHRVEFVALQGKTHLRFSVLSYKNKDATVAFDQKALMCEYNLYGENPIKQAYLYLKTLPELNGAIDC